MAPVAAELGRASRPVVSAALLTTAIFIVLVGGAYPWLASQPVRIMTQAVVLLAVATWLVVALVRPSWRSPIDVVLPVGIGLAAGALATLFSERPRLSAESFLVGSATALGYLLASRIASDRFFRPRLTAMLVMLPVLLMVAYVIEVVGAWSSWWMVVGQLTVPPLRPATANLSLGAPTVVGAALVLLVPVAVAFLAARGARLLAIAVAAVACAAVVVTGSRGAFLGFGSGAVALGILALPRLISRPRLRAAGLLAYGWAVIAAGSAAVLGLVLVAPALAGRIMEPGGIDQRLDFWRAAIAIFERNPLTGSGPGTWAQLKFAENPIGSPNLVVPHAHSLYVQTLSEVGLLGAVAMLLIAAIIARRLVRATRSDDRELRFGSIGAIGGLAALAGQSLVDNFVNLPSLCLLAILVVAWVEGGLRPSGRSPANGPLPRRAGGVTVVLTLVGVIIATSLVAVDDRAALLADQGTNAAYRGDWLTARDAFDAALAIDSAMTVYRLERGVAAAFQGDRAAALADLADVAEVDGLPIHLVSLARLEVAGGNVRGALEHAKEALDRSATDPVIALNAGSIAERAGDRALALRGYSEAIAAYPELAGARYWREPGRTIPVAELVEAARRVVHLWDYPGAAQSAAVVRAFGGDPSGALGEVSLLPTSAATDRAVAICLWLEGRHDDAISRLTAALDVEPRDASISGLLARFLADRGDEAGAARFRRWTEVIDEGAASRATVFGGQVETVREAGTSEIAPNYPWMIYLRRGPAILTPPDALVIAGE